MLTFYYHPLSPFSQRVWISLLEKQVEFQPVVIDLAKQQQYRSDFLNLNPFHRVPVLVDETVHLIESVAILDYLDLQFPHPDLKTLSAAAVARLRMIQTVGIYELDAKLGEFINSEIIPVAETTIAQVSVALKFLDEQLGASHFWGETFVSSTDIVLGVTLTLLSRLGLSIKPYSNLTDWLTRISERSAWTAVRPSDKSFEQFKKFIQHRFGQ